MKRKTVDARGLACPEPVVRVKKALEEAGRGEILVLVDSETARDNIIRLARSQDCAVAVTETAPAAFELRINNEKAAPDGRRTAAGGDRIVYLLETDYIGSNRELGKVLMNGFLTAMQNIENKNCAIVLISNAVRLAIEGSYVLEVLKNLEGQGFAVYICGTCLNYFKIREKVRVGAISNALEILECLTGGAKVIRF